MYPTFVTMDNPGHDRYRRMLTKEFTVRRAEGYRSLIKEVLVSVADHMLELSPPVDFIQEFALALPSSLICHILGVPYEDRELFQRLTRIMASGSSSPEEGAQATTELCEGYLRDLVQRKDREPTDDLLSRLVVEQVRPGHLTIDEAVALGRLLVVAGHDTTASMIGLSTLSMLLDRRLWGSVAADHSTITRTVEELLRFWNIDNFGSGRVATEDVVVGDQLVRSGEGVLALFPSADRDESIFAAAGEICPARDNVRDHLAFGYGIHQCLGQNIARVELQEVLLTLVTRLDTLELAVPVEDLEFDYDMFNYGVSAMPVGW
jgi:cytochrome P450